MIILVHTITTRLRYITEFIGRELTGEPIVLTTDLDQFNQSPGPRIVYGSDPTLPGDFFLHPHPILFESGIQKQAIICRSTHAYKYFFATKGDIPFDIFAASFYLITRYEEYLPHRKDFYGRYAHGNSLAFHENFLHLPLINIWIKCFGLALQAKCPELQLRSTSFRFQPTYDIDEAWAYRHKDWKRTWGGALKALVKGQWAHLGMRIRVLRNKTKDPYDSYAWMDELHEKYQLDPTYFFLVPDENGVYDRNILPKEKGLLELIRAQAEKYKIGIHPSWQSGDHPTLIASEINTLEKAAGLKIHRSRQHYIRLTIPISYRYLLLTGVREDYSMGYGSINGFRASVASPFYWYDLEKDECSSLLVYPFCFMEANSFFEQKLKPAQALEEMRAYAATVREVNGLFSCVWHNSFLGTEPLFAGWREVYEQFIKEQAT